MPHLLGDNGDIVAILWVSHEPLVVPPAADRNNKILWAARTPGAPLQIRATISGKKAPATGDRARFSRVFALWQTGSLLSTRVRGACHRGIVPVGGFEAKYRPR